MLRGINLLGGSNGILLVCTRRVVATDLAVEAETIQSVKAGRCALYKQSVDHRWEQTYGSFHRWPIPI